MRAVEIAAAVVASSADLESQRTKDKQIEIYKDGNLIDIALVDAVVTGESFIGMLYGIMKILK